MSVLRRVQKEQAGLTSFLGLCLLLVSGCLETPAVQCADGRLCPAGRACDNVHGGCVLPDQLEQCAGRTDETSCSYQGVPDGACFGGVCFPAGCGNGEVEDGEACDDGNRLHGDGCAADCSSIEECGNGFVDTTRGESCDDGKHCQSVCRDGTPCAVNGDCAGIGAETCAPGASCDGAADCAGIGDGQCVPRDGDDCQASCVTPACGDGVLDLEFLEACDLGTANADDPDALCRTNCQPQRCGDGIVDTAAGENCDDGNLFPGDGCSGACVVEECGNGIIDLEEVNGSFLPAEECDDGENSLNHDGCVIGCRREAPVWTGPPPVFPSPRLAHAVAYDAARGKVVLFGGAVQGGLEGETWEYDGRAQTWSQVPVANPNAPSPRGGHAMAYDAARGKVLLFGGFDDAGNGETWEYDGPTQTWTQVPVASPDAPSPRNGHAMAYDAARGKVVLFGGQDDGGKSGETWEYDGATQTWTQVPVASPDAPSARNLHAMAYDAARGRVVLFGGINDGAIDGETWEYDSGTQSWARVQVASPDAPSPRSSAMAYDIARGKVVLFGGAAIGGLDAETWEYGGATQSWTQVPVASAGAPSPRDDHAMVYDAARGKVVLFGGRVGNPSRLNGETWEYDGATQTWNEVPVASPDAPSPRAGAMAYDAARGKIVLFGGSDATGVNGETWEYDGATESWTQVAVASPDAPSPRSGHAMVYDAGRRRVVLFGGGDDETWEYDGPTQSWTQVAQAGSLPRPRRDHAMAYDAARGKVVLFGSISLGGGDTETWEYGATQSWTQVPVGAPNSPSLRFRHAMAYDAARGEVVLFGGDNGSGITNDESWTFQHTAGVADACTPGFDGDGDGLVGCDDPDCWGFCTPHCPVNSTPLWPTDCDTAQPHCGDGVCNPFLETPRLCPGDCGPPAPLCGDFHCDDFEDAASCPGDCTP